jgi:AraC-like DNA-binding protein
VPIVHGPSAQYQEIATNGHVPAERFAFWRSACLKLVEPIGAPDGGYERFSARSQRLAGGMGSFTDNSVTPMNVQRTQRLCRRDGVDDIVISLELGSGGTGRLGASDKSVVFAPGALNVLDFGQPLLANWDNGPHRGLLLCLPRASVLPALGRHPPDLHGALLAPGGLAPLLAAQMRALADLLPSLNGTVRALALQASIDLAVTVLCHELGTARAESAECEDGMFVAAQAFICRHFGSTDLTPEQIAHRLGCSRAHLYRVFARNGLTVAGYLRDFRLERSRAALVNAGPRETVGDIAFRCGFDNPVHFARLFRQRFGMRPTDARRRDE